jgi:hypothetical protein
VVKAQVSSPSPSFLLRSSARCVELNFGVNFALNFSSNP